MQEKRIKALMEEVNEIKSRYPCGTLIRCIKIQDNTVKQNEVGIVELVDDSGRLHVHWQNGHSSVLTESKDKFEVLLYSIEGYDKDNDVYFVLGYFSCWSIALTTASDLSKKLSMLYNPDKHEPIDWLVVRDLGSNCIIAHSDISNKMTIVCKNRN